MEPLTFLLLSLAYGLYIIYSSIRTNKKLQNHRVHSIVFPDEELNVVFRKAKVDGEKFYRLVIVTGLMIIFAVVINLIKYVVDTKYMIITAVYIISVICISLHLANPTDFDGFWVGSSVNLKGVIHYYEVQDFKQRTQWKEIIGELPMIVMKNGTDDFVTRYPDCFYMRILYLLSLLCFFVSMLLNIFY